MHVLKVCSLCFYIGNFGTNDFSEDALSLLSLIYFSGKNKTPEIETVYILLRAFLPT